MGIDGRSYPRLREYVEGWGYREPRIGDRLPVAQAIKKQKKVDEISGRKAAWDIAEKAVEQLNEKASERQLTGHYCRLYGEEVVCAELTYSGKWQERLGGKMPKKVQIETAPLLKTIVDEEERTIDERGLSTPFVEGEFQGFSLHRSPQGRPEICYDVQFDETDLGTCQVTLRAFGKVDRTYISFLKDIALDKLEGSLIELLLSPGFQAHDDLKKIDKLLRKETTRPVGLFHEVSDIVRNLIEKYPDIAKSTATLDRIARIIEHYMIMDLGEGYSISAERAARNKFSNGELKTSIKKDIDIMALVHGVIILPQSDFMKKGERKKHIGGGYEPCLVVEVDLGVYDKDNPEGVPMIVPFSALIEFEDAF